MKHCEAIDVEITPTGAVFKGAKWPATINVERGLLDYLPGPHVTFGRNGILRFACRNGYAVYRRLEDVVGGWSYELKEHNLTGADKPGPAAEPRPQKANKVYRRGSTGPTVDAFHWLPNAVPPLELPDWFLRADFQHVTAKGQLVLRNPAGMPMTAQDGDFVIRDGSKIFPLPAKAFVEQYTEA